MLTVSAACSPFLFQFTPLREGRRWLYTQPSFSRHFNSRPSARGDQNRRNGLYAADYFNSRPSARGDFFCGENRLRTMGISIHAPPRGATGNLSGLIAPSSFQFTPLREGRPLRFSFPHATRVFQFTPLREGRRLVKQGKSVDLISIHAPPRGATQVAETRAKVRQNFNSRPSARGDKGAIKDGDKLIISIHAPPRGATR